MENAGKEDIPEDAERRGLGTPATRAAIIEKLLSGGFVERKGKNLIPTKAGVNLVTVLPELLTSPKLTADWEQRLNEVAKGQASPQDFIDGIEAMAAELVRKYSHISEDGQMSYATNALQFVQPLHLHRKFQNRGNLQCLPYRITHLHCIFHTLSMECCYMYLYYILYFVLLGAFTKMVNGHIILLTEVVNGGLA